YKMTSYSGFLNLVASLNNIMFHKERNKVDWYIFGGIGGVGYTTKVDAFDAGNTAYDPTAITATNKNDIKDQVANAHDGTYETTVSPADEDGEGPFWNLSFDAGMGIAFRISPHFN